MGLYDAVKKVYGKMKQSPLLPLFIKLDKILQTTLGGFYGKIFGKMKDDVKYQPQCWNGPDYTEAGLLPKQYEWDSDEKNIWKDEKKILVSVLAEEAVPESLKRQTYTCCEVVLMKKQGSHLDKWKEACDRAQGELIWIPDKHREYSSNYLEELVEAFDYSSTTFAFGKNADEKKEKQGGRASFRMAAHMFVQKEWKQNNWKVDIHDGIFRNTGHVFSDISFTCNASEKEVAALSVMRGGCIAYIPSASVYQTEKTQEDLEDKTPQQTYIAQYYDAGTKKNPNVLMACYSLQPGGGETYPIYLANEMHRQHITVALLDMKLGNTEKNIRKMVHPGVPIIRCKDEDEIPKIILQMGIDVIHTHQATVDCMVARWIGYNALKCRQYVTLHGMYESLDLKYVHKIIEVLDSSCAHYIYIADKNLTPFRQLGYYLEERFTKMPNGLPTNTAHEISRKSLQIEEDAFVFCLASRGIPEKGWREAIEAVTKAREKTGKKIELLLVGGGKEKKRLEKKAPSYIHFTGVRDNVRDYYKTADAGILPTRFRGESYPLVVIECLQCQKPIIATDIAEVRHQLQDEDGNLAGELLTLHDWKLDVDEIADKICHFVEDKEYYRLLQQRCQSAAKKFDIAEIVRQYLNIYKTQKGKKK